MIEHWGMVRRVSAGRATVIIETTACPVCGHGDHCGIGRQADGRAATVDLPACQGLKEGDFVRVGMPEFKLTLAAALGYLFPALASLLGALLGLAGKGSDGTAALGAAIGFIASLIVARCAIALTPGLTPSPRILSTSPIAATFPQE